MNIQNIVDKFISNPKYLRLGAGKLATRFGTTKEDIYKAKEKARQSIHNNESTALQLIISEQEENIAQLLSSEEGVKDGVHSATKTFSSSRILTQSEIKELSGVDDITSRLGMVWSKLQSNGKWTYSIQVTYPLSNFYSKDELKEKLKELFPDTITPVRLPTVVSTSPKALTILMSDEHIGHVQDRSMFNNMWTEDMYMKRLFKIVDEVKALGQTFEEVHLFSLGDQLNGFNSQTTRGGHEVKSLPNKDQFDIYTRCRKVFYEELFTSGVSDKYFVHDVDNSNHSGKGFSYMANQYLDLFLELKFPEVKRYSYLDPYDYFDYGVHTIGFGHGKDEQFQFRALPLKLDAKTDSILQQFFDKKGKSPSKRRITFYKGDLHSYAIDKGKFGRYINVPSMVGSTEYSEVNFGDTEAGIILEILHRDDRKVEHIPIWF